MRFDIGGACTRAKATEFVFDEKFADDGFA